MVPIASTNGSQGAEYIRDYVFIVEYAAIPRDDSLQNFGAYPQGEGAGEEC